MARSWSASLVGGRADADSRLAWWIIIGTLPAVAFGFVLKDLAENELRAIWIMASSLIVFGLLLGWADWRGRRDRDEYQLNLRAVLVIGFAQVLALIPGHVAIGYHHHRRPVHGPEPRGGFAFLVSALDPGDLRRNGAGAARPLVGGAVHALGPAGAGVHRLSTEHLRLHSLLPGFIKRIGMQPFVVYRIALGLLLLFFYF